MKQNLSKKLFRWLFRNKIIIYNYQAKTFPAVRTSGHYIVVYGQLLEGGGREGRRVVNEFNFWQFNENHGSIICLQRKQFGSHHNQNDKNHIYLTNVESSSLERLVAAGFYCSRSIGGGTNK